MIVVRRATPEDSKALAPRTIASSIPHRSPEEREAMTLCLLGVTTWQKVARAFGLPKEVLIPMPPRQGARKGSFDVAGLDAATP